MTKYVLETGFRMQAKDFDLSIPDVLRYANLPQDLFLKSPVMVTREEYLRLWGGQERLQRPVLFDARCRAPFFKR
ncbi:MAG: hypothetical protein AAF633_19755 [Chloroflexota bacterium]